MAIRKYLSNVQKDTLDLYPEQIQDSEIQQQLLNFFINNAESDEMEAWSSTDNEGRKIWNFRSRNREEESDEDFKVRLTDTLNIKLESINRVLTEAREIEEQINNL